MSNGPVYLLATALTCIMSVTPLSTFNTPPCTSVVILYCCAHAATSSVAGVGDAVWASAAAFLAGIGPRCCRHSETLAAPTATLPVFSQSLQKKSSGLSFNL